MGWWRYIELPFSSGQHKHSAYLKRLRGKCDLGGTEFIDIDHAICFYHHPIVNPKNTPRIIQGSPKTGKRNNVNIYLL